MQRSKFAVLYVQQAMLRRYGRHAVLKSGDVSTQVIEHVAAALGKDPRDVKQLNFLKPPEQVLADVFCSIPLLTSSRTCHVTIWPTANTLASMSSNVLVHMYQNSSTLSYYLVCPGHLQE